MGNEKRDISKQPETFFDKGNFIDLRWLHQGDMNELESLSNRKLAWHLPKYRILSIKFFSSKFYFLKWHRSISAPLVFCKWHFYLWLIFVDC
jgi:hypothetical protein